MRTITEWNENWKVWKTADEPDTAVQTVTLPWTWNAVDGQDGGNDYYRGTYTYEKSLARPALPDGRRLFLEVTAAGNSARVLVNGEEIARHDGGYSAFRADLTDFLTEETRITILADNSENDRVYPQMADFTFCGGLYRGVKLIEVPSEHFELVKDGTPGIKVTPLADLETGTAEVTVESWQNAESVTFTVTDQDGNRITEQGAVPEQGHAQAVFTIPHAHLWDGLADPYLYTASARLESGDVISTRFGIRQIALTGKGFFLNGRPYPLRGAAKHQDRGGVGNAVTREMLEEDMAIIREMGATAVRLAHYQHPQEFYELCDENGVVVWAEIPFISSFMENGRANTVSQMRELITQCYNHPSIVCWGLSNEITAAAPADEALLANHRELNDLCHRMDPTRPTTIAHVFMLETDSPLIDIADSGAYNLYFGWYLGSLDQNDAFFDEYHAKYPNRPIGFSEYGADANPAFQTACPACGDYTEQYQCVYHEHLLKMIEKRPYLWFTSVWNLFDFAADGRDEGGAHGLNQKGLVTIDRRVKKDAFYLYKAAWSSEPFVHLCGSRYVNRAENVTEVKVYSNQPAVTLSVDGAEVGTQEGVRIFVFEVPIRGEHVITARAGECSDSIRVKKVSEPDPAYLFVREKVVNWFDREILKRDCYSVEDTLSELEKNPQAAAIVADVITEAAKSRGDVASSMKENNNILKMMAGMKLSDLLARAGDAVSPEQVKELNEALQRITKDEI